MKNTNKKRGFTLIELVVVVAVIAILSAVLIPTFTGIINKANRSSDEQAVYSMNKILAADEILNGKPDTAYEALAVLAESGYKPEGLNAKSDDYQMLWNADANRIVLLDKDSGAAVIGELSATDVNNWAFVDKNLDAKYSSYLMDNFAKTSVVSMKGGVDVGNNSGVSVGYTNTAIEDDLVFRTNGGVLSINAEKANVAHYGYADSVKIDAVAQNSFHEFGVAGTVTIEKGRFVVEADAFINKIVLAGADVNVVKAATSDALILAIEVAAGVTVDETKLTAIEAIVTEATEIEVEDNTVALVINANGVTEFSDIAKAFAVKGSKTITLVKDVENAPYLKVTDGENVVLDLGGCTLSTKEQSAGRHFYLDNYGTLTILGGTFNGRGIENLGAKATLNIDGATINSIDKNGGACVWNVSGTLNVISGNFNALNGDYGTTGTYDKDPIAIYNDGGNVNVYGGTFRVASGSYVINNVEGDLTITGGDFAGTRGVIGTNDGTTKITGGKFTQLAVSEIAPNNTELNVDDILVYSYVIYAGTNVSVTVGDNVVVEQGNAHQIYHTNNDSATINGNSYPYEN